MTDNEEHFNRFPEERFAGEPVDDGFDRPPPVPPTVEKTEQEPDEPEEETRG
jgi:hypothetical protein